MVDPRRDLIRASASRGEVSYEPGEKKEEERKEDEPGGNADHVALELVNREGLDIVLGEELGAQTLGEVDLREEERVVVLLLVLGDVLTFRELAGDDVPAELAKL